MHRSGRSLRDGCMSLIGEETPEPIRIPNPKRSRGYPGDGPIPDKAPSRVNPRLPWPLGGPTQEARLKDDGEQVCKSGERES